MDVNLPTPGEATSIDFGNGAGKLLSEYLAVGLRSGGA